MEKELVAANNYHPITLVPALTNVLEKITATELVSLINIICSATHSFVLRNLNLKNMQMSMK
jgi:hypothetical protein